SASSTAVQAAQLTTTSWPATAAAIASAAVRSSEARDAVVTSSRAVRSRSTRSVPSMPWAPVTSQRMRSPSETRPCRFWDDDPYPTHHGDPRAVLSRGLLDEPQDHRRLAGRVPGVVPRRPVLRGHRPPVHDRAGELLGLRGRDGPGRAL